MPDPINIDDEQNSDWLHQSDPIRIYKDDQLVAKIEGENVESSDPALEEMLYQLIDEGVPNNKPLPEFLREYGYEVR